AKSLCASFLGSDGRVARRAVAFTADHPGSELSPLCRRACFPRRAELLERRLQSSLHCGGSCGAAAISSRSRNPRDLPRDIPDRLWLVLLSLGSKRPHAVLGPAAHDAVLHGDSCGRRRGARERTVWSRSALAAARNRNTQFVAVALLWGSAALRLCSILSLPRLAAAAPDVPTQIFRHVLLGRCRRALCACQAVRALRPRGLFEFRPERSYAQAPLCGCCLFRGAEIFPDAPTHRLNAPRPLPQAASPETRQCTAPGGRSTSARLPRVIRP